MNQELPKPILDALAREATPGAHPSPDVLTAFVERTLLGGEKQRITDHLSRCTECREVVFLASSAAEETVTEEQDWMEAAAVPRISPALQAKAHASQAMASASLAEAPRRRWALQLVWAVPIAAAVLLIAGLLVQQRFAAIRSAPQLASKLTGNAPGTAPAETQQIAIQPSAEPAAAKPGVERQTRTVRAKNLPSKSFDTLAMTYDAMGVVDQSPAPQGASRAVAAHEPAAGAIGGPATPTAPATPRANGFVAGEAEREKPETDAISQFRLAPQVSNRALNAIHPQWRVTAEGHLEHSVPSGWTRVLGNETASFRVVSIVGNDVWAGGNGGALFHSSDSGQNWNKVALATSSDADTAIIVSIRFDDPQHGVVITESGLRCSTSDGGMTWTKE